MNPSGLALLPEDQALTAIKTAIDSGSNYINAGEFYGKPDHNSLTLLRKYFAKYPEDASKIVLNVKGCLDVKELSPNGTKESTAKIIENCLSMLGPDARIDQLEPARKDAKVDFENDTLATIDGYVKAGKIGAISCSELALESFRKAAKAYKISSLEIEFSLFRIEPLTNGLLAACAELDVPVLAYCRLSLSRPLENISEC